MQNLINRLEEIIISVLMAMATLVIFVAVVHRYMSGYAIPGLQDWLLSLDLSWAQEFCTILFVWMAKFGAAYGVRTGIHVGVDLLVNKVSESKRRLMIQLGLVAGLVFTGILVVFGSTFVWENGLAYKFLMATTGDAGHFFEGPITPDLEWPTWIIYSAVPVGSALMFYRFWQVLVNYSRTGELPRHDVGHVEGIDGNPQEEMSLGEAIESAEEIEHAHGGLSDAEWKKKHPNQPDAKQE